MHRANVPCYISNHVMCIIQSILPFVDAQIIVIVCFWTQTTDGCDDNLTQHKLASTPTDCYCHHSRYGRILMVGQAWTIIVNQFQ